MKLPVGWEKFYGDVVLKVKTLTSTNIWNFDSLVALAWLSNFKDDRHKYLAAHILDRLTYRTEKMTESTYRRFLSSTFRTYVEGIQGKTGENVEGWLNGLNSRNCSWTKDILICSVTIPGEHGESGSQIIRMLTGELFCQSHIYPIDTCKLSDVSNKIILIVDDFVGSGQQFETFSNEVNLREAANNNKIIYAPAMAYHLGKKNIIEMNYGIDFFPLEVLTKKEQFFSHDPGAMFCGDEINSEQDAIDCYQEMRNLNQQFGKGCWMGRDKASLCVGFQWGCPNQTLGLIWYEGSNDWNRLFRKRGSQ